MFEDSFANVSNLDAQRNFCRGGGVDKPKKPHIRTKKAPLKEKTNKRAPT